MKNKKLIKDKPYLFTLLASIRDYSDSDIMAFGLGSFATMIWIVAVYHPWILTLLAIVYIVTNVLWMLTDKHGIGETFHDEKFFIKTLSGIYSAGLLISITIGLLAIAITYSHSVFVTAIVITSIVVIALSLLYVFGYTISLRSMSTELTKGVLFTKGYSDKRKKEGVLDVVDSIDRLLCDNVMFARQKFPALSRLRTEVSDTNRIDLMELHYHDLLSIRRLCAEAPKRAFDSKEIQEEMNKKLEGMRRDLVELKDLELQVSRVEEDLNRNQKIAETLDILKSL